ncbi:TetR/AcrR family transcriptional regulator [Paenibacillus protaetiae]|nr:TetR/AcrR family transcriptional regulator [Paenibacillus protaetiae]
MSDKIDRRQARTKQLLRQALLELITEKGVDKLTVTDITTRADVNRGTFYLHYRDAPDMLKQIQDEVFETIRSLIQEMNMLDLMNYAERDEPYPKTVALLEEFARHGRFLRVTLGTKGDPVYATRFHDTMRELFTAKLAFWQPKDEDMLVPREYLITYMASANIGVVTRWLETGMKESPREIALILMRLINHGPLTATGLRNKTFA